MTRQEFFIVDDDPMVINLFRRYLEAAGHGVQSTTHSAGAVAEILSAKPSCVLLDIMMPEVDGLELLKRLRAEPTLKQTKFVVVSAKSYEFDRKRALEFGADGYIIKPVQAENFVAQLERIIRDQVRLTFWGVHGTLPVPGERTVRYGGNTMCMTLEFSRGNLFIFDAGTGIKELSNTLMAQRRTLASAKVFLSHPHWDHINAIPFFVPLFLPGNEFEICGPGHGDVNVREMVSAQMSGVYFPVNIKEFSAGVSFRDLKEERFEVDGIQVQTMLLNHPGYCLGYRMAYGDKLFCYVTDNELYPKETPFYDETYRQRLIAFVRGADALVTDCAYTDQDYERKVGWGHSCVSEVVSLAHEANVRNLYLVHHDTDQGDAEIDAKLEMAREKARSLDSRMHVHCPAERQEVFV